MREAVQKQVEHDTILFGHSVCGYLANQTVFVVVLGSVSDDIIVENRELIAVSGGRLGSETVFNKEFLESDKTKIAKELLKIDNMKELQNGEKNKERQVAIAFAEVLNQRAGGV